ncbi:MAG: leucine-rich repeat domain-containing protein [Acholeplasmatales bacterium]|nr:leucine-rich repeat domain-containing protein [Acholeplasmatales bacterium]
MMNKLKSKILIIISSVMIIASIFVVGVEAFYRFYYQNNGSKLSLVEVVFTVNDSNIKNTSDVVYFSTDEMSQGDGYEITLNYSINGTFSSTNAVKYSTFFNGLVGGEDSDGRDLTLGIEVYRFNSNRYEYLGTLNSLLYENSNKSVLTDYLGSSGTNREKFMLVYGEATKVKDRTAFALQVSTSSEVVTTDSSDFPYYYLSNLGKNSAESILEQLPRNNAVYGRTIVLMRDIDYHGDDIVFDHVVGIDLNGHTLNLNGASITINDTAEEETSFISNLGIINSKESGSVVGGIIKLDLTKTVLDVELPLTNYVEAPSINFDVFNEIVQNNLNEIASQKRLMNTESNNTFSYQFDVLKNLKYYIKKGTVTLDASASDFYVSFDSTNYTFKAEGLDTSNIVYVSVATAYSGHMNIANANLSLYGKSLEDAVDYLKSYIPVTIDGSIYLPQYLPAFNTYVTWVAFDSSLIDENGTVLPNGYINLDSWVTKNAKLGFILDQSGEIKNGIIDNITIEILSEEERAKLLHDFSITMFDYYNVTSYSFDTIDMIMYKRGKDISVDNLASFNAIKEVALSDFGIDLDYTYPTTTISQLKEEFKIRLFAKLGIDEITVSTINESNYVANDVDANGSITLAHQLNLPKDTLDLIYTVNYKFLTGNTVTENKTIAVSNGENSTTATDITNTIRVPFDTYTRSMTTPITTSPYLYEKFVDTFELVSDFSGTPVNYTVDDEFKDYVEILTIEGKKYVHILTGKSPSKTTKVKVYYDIAGTTNSVDFTLVGILHNGKEIVDANLYVELLANFDTNKDNILTVLESEHATGTSFAWNSRGIVSLQGLRYFTNITSLSLNGNKIIDIEDLAYLTNLTSLDLRYNYISDISSLEYLDKLNTLNLQANQITDISPIQNLTALKYLNLAFNKISDFSYIQNLTIMENLFVFNNYNSSGECTVGDDAGNDYITTIRKSNQYYFALLAAKRISGTYNVYIKTIDDSKRNTGIDTNKDPWKLSKVTFDTNTKNEALILNKIVTVSEVDNVIVLPTIVKYGTDTNHDYEITYFADSSDSSYVSISRSDYGSNQMHVTNVTINQIPVDNEVSIYAYTIGLSGIAIYRRINFVILEGGATGKIELKEKPTDEDSFFVYANVLIPDLKLRAQIFKTFDANKDGTISYTELTTDRSLDLEFVGVKNLSGIQYFTGITSLNLRGNVLTDTDDLWYVSYLQNLTTLKLDGQEYDFDKLVYFSRKDSATYESSANNTFTVTDISATDHSVLGTYGLTSLTTLNVNGCHKLNEDEIKTELYHVYLNNSVNIYKQDESTIWDPIKDEVSKLLGGMTTSATFVNFYDTLELAKNYSFYLYDDLLPTSFTLGYTAPSDTYYNHNYNFGTAIPDIYYFADNDTSTTKVSATTFGFYNKIPISNFFKKIDSTNKISIIYTRLVSFDLTAYASMSLTSNNVLWNSKSISSSVSNYSLAMNIQYNDMYKLYNDLDETDSINENGGTPLNKVFGAIESNIFIMGGLCSQIYGVESNIPGNANNNFTFTNKYAMKNFYYTVTDVNGNVSHYVKFGNDAAVEYGSKALAIAEVENFETTGSVYYNGATRDVHYKNGYIMYTSQLLKDFKYAGDGGITKYFKGSPFRLELCSKTAYAEVVSDGLQYVPFVEYVAGSNGMNYGDGHTLINVKGIYDVYGYVNLATISTPLPKLEFLALNVYFMTEFGLENGASDSDPNKLLESYFVYMPNLRTFFSHINNTQAGEFGSAIVDWSAFLAYAYIPYTQATNEKYYTVTDGGNVLDMSDVMVGGMSLQDNYLYYYDDSYPMDNSFRKVYDDEGNVLVVTDFTLETLTSSSDGYYINLFDDYHNPLSTNKNLFRKSQKNQFNYFGINSDKANTGTFNQKVCFTHLYKNAKDTVKSWYFYLMGEGNNNNVSKAFSQSGSSLGDWSPETVEVSYKPTEAMELSEFKNYIAHYDVKLTGTTYNGTSLSDINYDSIDWNSVEYVDMFKSGLTAKLPTKTNEFITGDSKFDDCREFNISWKLITLDGSSQVAEDIDENNATLTNAAIPYYSYTFSSEGYYIILATINNNSSAGMMFVFTITDKSEANFSEWYEKIKDKTLKYITFISDVTTTKTINKSYSEGYGSTYISKDVDKKYVSNIYTLDGIDSLSSLEKLTLKNYRIPYIPNLPKSIKEIDLSGNMIGDIGDIFNGSNYTKLTKVTLVKNPLNLKESNFKNGSYYTTEIKTLNMYSSFDDNSRFYIDSTQLSYFTELKYSNAITIKFKDELYWNYNGTDCLTKESLDELIELLGKTNVTVKMTISWNDDATANLSDFQNLAKAYASIGNPNGTVSISAGTINESTVYTFNNNYGVSGTPTVNMVWNGQNGTTNYYQKMVTPYYLVKITVGNNNLYVVKELNGRFYSNQSANATLNTIPIATLQANVDHRMIELLYKNSTFDDSSNEFAGTLNLSSFWLDGTEYQSSLDIQGGTGPILDLKGLSSFNITALYSYNDINVREIKNPGSNSIVKIVVKSPYSLVTNIEDSTTSVNYSFDNKTAISRDVLNIDSNGTFNALFSYTSITVESPYNYCLTNSFKLNGLKTSIYNELTGTNTNLFHDKLKDKKGSVTNLSSLHTNKAIEFYGATLYSDSIFDRKSTKTVLGYGINVATNSSRILTNETVIKATDSDAGGQRYILIDDSKIHFPKTLVFNGETVTFTNYSASNGNLGLNEVTDEYGTYWKMTVGSINTNVENIKITATYSSTSYSGNVTFYVDVKAGKNAGGDNYTEAITTWYVEMQDGTLVHAGDLFSSPVLAANIFNGLPKVTFGTNIEIVTTTAVDQGINKINGNLLMDEIRINGVLCKVLRQNVISQIQSIHFTDRAFMYYDGLEIFYNCRALQVSPNGVGYDFAFASNMQLELFTYKHKRNSITTTDFSFLNNSRDTLKQFIYGYSNDNDKTPLEDMSWLLAFDNLTKVELSGPSGIENNPTFKYFLTAMYLKYHKSIVTYNGNGYDKIDISDYLKSAATIMYDLSSFDTSNDSSFIYQNGFELFSKTGSIDETSNYYLPSYIYSGGEYYKLHWESLSTFVDINVVKNDDTELTPKEYENEYAEWKLDNPEDNDYEFCKDYIFKVKFKNLVSTTSYKAFISMKIEYESKFDDSYAPVTTSIIDMTTNYSRYYTASYNTISSGTEFVKNKYYRNDSGDYKLLLVEPDDWDSGTYYDIVFTQCTSSSTYDSGTKYYTKYIYTPYMYERILTVNLAKNNIYKQYLMNEDSYSHADYVTTNASVYDGTALSGTYYSSVTSSNPEVVQVVEHNVIAKETHYFVKSGNDLIRVTKDNYNTLISDSNYGENATVYYYFLGRVCAAVDYSNKYYRYDSTTDKYINLSTKPSGWKNANSSNYYSITNFNITTTLGALSDLYANDLNISTKVYGIYLKNPDYTGLVTLTCTLADGSGTETRYVYWQR